MVTDIHKGEEQQEWTEVIRPYSRFFDLKIKELWDYRDLIYIFVKRDIVATYKQTLLGPLWFFISPFITVLIYSFVFSRIAGISTEGIPAPLFYLAGTSLWGYFQQCFLSSSGTFVSNASIFGKVYFPRMVAPISTVLSNIVKFGIQLLVLVVYVAYFAFSQNYVITPSVYLLLFPALIIIMAGLALGGGILISALTTKYRDLQIFIGYGIALLMYACPVIYPVSAVPEKYKIAIQLNPVTPLIETFRLGVFGQGSFSWLWLGYSFIFMVILLVGGMLIFNRVEKNFMDTV